MNITELKKNNKSIFEATMYDESKSNKINYTIVIPCYKREKEVQTLLKKYINFPINIVLAPQNYSVKFYDFVSNLICKISTSYERKIEKHKNLQNKTHNKFVYKSKNKKTKLNSTLVLLNYDNPQNIGFLRKAMLSEAIKLNTKYILMHDNDISFSFNDIDMMSNYLIKYPKIKVVSPDIYSLCKKSNTIATRLCFVATMFRTKDVKKVYMKMSNIQANEDSELVYLLENKGLAINQRLFSFRFKDYQSKTTYDNKLKKLKDSALYLKKKYKDDVIIVKRPSGKYITQFKFTKKFPMSIRFNEKPTTEYYNSKTNMKVSMLAYPDSDYLFRCYSMLKSTWLDEPQNVRPSKQELVDTFKKILSFRVLPNSLEHLSFTFLIEGLTLVEITHLLRHRAFYSIHAQCSADRFLTHDSVFMPSSIENSKFKKEYIELTEKTKKLYQKMIDSKQISLLDARYILPRNHRYFYYVSMNLKDAISFINQRKCTQVQPEMDNILAYMIYNLIAIKIPEIKEVIKLECDKNCYYVKAPSEDNSRVFYPDSIHIQHMKKDIEFLYDKKTRKQMGVWFNLQDEK
jgi:thymidylate synthase ThyX